mgnify:CR=1 FL=1
MNILKVKRKKASVAVHLVAVRDKNKTFLNIHTYFKSFFLEIKIVPWTLLDIVPWFRCEHVMCITVVCVYKKTEIKY